MSSARYAPLPNPRSVSDLHADREMHEAFQLDNDEEEDDSHSESSPLTGRHDYATSPNLERPALPIATPGTYDFEREYDYDYPPPGSPPDPSIAMPNNFGNTNGNLPSTPALPIVNRPSIFRRVAGALLPQHYQRLPTESGSQRVIGGGMDNDGVFGNVMAKPARHVQVTNENGDILMVPEESQSQAPPSYNEAQADAVPAYWETTIHAPSNLDPNADMIVDDLPTGSWYLFIANVFISFFFQFIGFLFTYLLHTTHAAKFGSRVGLGLTLIQFGFYSRRQAMEDGEVNPALPSPSFNETVSMIPGINSGNSTDVERILESYDVGSRDWVAFLLMTLGWFLLLSSLAGFYRVKRWESSIRSASRPAAATDHETETHRAMEHDVVYPLFMALGGGQDDENSERRTMSDAETRLTRDLRAAGLI